MTIHVPGSAEPSVSVVMPVYGARAEVERSLRALAEHTEAAFEAIVVDNASPDGTTAWLRDEVAGAVLVLNEQNRGFGAACNQGAGLARAPTVVFLNSDAFVQPGWLEPLVATLALPGAAGVSARLLHPDGRLQEAGALIGRSGVGVAYGNTHDPHRFAFRFRRTVDYASGACLAVRRDAFLAHGGFDPAFGLAYCEDVDLSLRLRRAGWSTYYEPRATAVHLQGASSASERARSLRDANTAILRERYGALLAARPPLDDLLRYPHRTLASRDACTPDRLLVLAGALPDPSSPVGRFVGELADARPDARIAVLTVEPPAAGVDAWGARGVEVAEDADHVRFWLRDRVGHFGAVIAPDEGAEAALGALVRRTQPQAEWVARDRMSAGRGLLPELGWAPPPRDPAPGEPDLSG